MRHMHLRSTAHQAQVLRLHHRLSETIPAVATLQPWFLTAAISQRVRAHTQAHLPSGEAALPTGRPPRRVSHSATRPSPPAVTSDVCATSAAAATPPPAAQVVAGLLGFVRSSHLRMAGTVMALA